LFKFAPLNENVSEELDEDYNTVTKVKERHFSEEHKEIFAAD